MASQMWSWDGSGFVALSWTKKGSPRSRAASWNGECVRCVRAGRERVRCRSEGDARTEKVGRARWRPTVATQDAPVILWVPNLIGYVRLVLLFVAFLLLAERPWSFWAAYGMSVGLDAVDGMSARRLGQTSEYGAFLDVVIDNVSRGLLTCRAFPTFGPLLCFLEFTVFAVNHRLGAEWKQVIMTDAPWLVKEVMRNGLRQPLGAVSMVGLFLLPVHGYMSLQWPTLVQHAGWKLLGHALLAARLLCASVEAWCISKHCGYLISLQKRSAR